MVSEHGRNLVPNQTSHQSKDGAREATVSVSSLLQAVPSVQLCLIMQIDGLASKQESLEQILDNRDCDIACVSETNVHGNKKINLKNYVSFTKNNPNKKSMGGLLTSVNNEM